MVIKNKFKKIHILQIVLFVIPTSIPFISSAQSQNSVNIYKGSFFLNIRQRPSAPYPALQNYNSNLTAHGNGQEFRVPVSRHHIIPFNILRDFYNRVSANNRLRRIGGFLFEFAENIEVYANRAGLNVQRIGPEIQMAANLSEGQAIGFTRPAGRNTPPEFDTFEQFYAWIPGNLFIGPRNRSDDPENNFERNARVFLTQRDYERLERIYQDMVSYIETNDNGALFRLANDLPQLARRTGVYDIDPEAWEFVNGQYRLINRNRLAKKDDYIDANLVQKQDGSDNGINHYYRPSLLQTLMQPITFSD